MQTLPRFILALTLVLSACGGGGSDSSGPAATTPPPANVTYPPAIAGDPAFSSECSAAPVGASIGPFATQAGDCFVSYQITDADLSAYRADYTSAPVTARLMADVAANFQDGIDVVIVLLDLDSSQQGTLPYGVNYPYQACSVHDVTCPRFSRLGNVWLVARDYLKNGPSLHEILHGFHNQMSPNETDQFIVPTSVAAHWGFSSVGGQLGGWDPSTFSSVGGGTYHATGPAVPPQFAQPTTFGLNANGGNSIPYSNLELWTMGLISDAELQSVTVAQNAAFTGAGSFTATGLATYSAQDIVGRVQTVARPKTTTPRAFRGLVVLATTASSVSPSTTTQINSDVQQFTMRAATTQWNGLYNFWTGTGQRATLQLASASGLSAR